jgi:hypothetical protein
MICGAYNKSKKSPCTAKGKEKYDGRCGNHRERNKVVKKVVEKKVEVVEKKVEIEEKDCCVCSDDCTKTTCVTFKCGHFLCGDCWIRNGIVGVSKVCPMCRARIEIDEITGDKAQFSTHFVQTYSSHLISIEEKYRRYRDILDTIREMCVSYDLDDELLHATIDFDNSIDEYNKVVKIIIELSKMISQHI